MYKFTQWPPVFAITFLFFFGGRSQGLPPGMSTAAPVVNPSTPSCQHIQGEMRLYPTIPDWQRGKLTVAEWVTPLVWETNGRRAINEHWKENSWILQKKKAGNGVKLQEIKMFLFTLLFASFRRMVHADNLLFVLQEVGLVDYHSHHARDYSSHLSQPHRRRPSLLSEFQPGNERSVHQAHI